LSRRKLVEADPIIKQPQNLVVIASASEAIHLAS
jgi:hypothetical protein